MLLLLDSEAFVMARSLRKTGGARGRVVRVGGAAGAGWAKVSDTAMTKQRRWIESMMTVNRTCRSRLMC